MPAPITIDVPLQFSEEEARKFVHELAAQISERFGLLTSTISFIRNDRNKIAQALMCFEDYSAGNPLTGPPELLRKPLEEAFGSAYDHREEHQRAKALSRLAAVGITQVGQLLYCSSEYLLSPDVPQFGDGLLLYVKKQLADFGITIPDELS